MTPSIGLVLTPGASATRDHSSLVAIEDALGDDVAVARIDLGKSRKPEAHVTVITEAAARLAGEHHLAPDRLALGGRSFGGRMCSMAVAGGLPALALVLISYPLHPPGKPDQLRTAHFPEIRVPCLFVSGTRDAFGSPDELTAAVGAIGGPVTLEWIEGGDHGLRGRDAAVAAIVRDWLLPRRADRPGVPSPDPA